MQRSTTLAAMILLLAGLVQPAMAGKPASEPKKLAITILNNGFQPVAGAKIDEELLDLLDAERASDQGLLAVLQLEQCTRPLTEDCLLFAMDRTRLELAAELTRRGTAGWIVVVRTGSSPYDGLIWTVGANNLGGMRHLSQRYPGKSFDGREWLGIAAYADLCPNGEEDGRCVVH